MIVYCTRSIEKKEMTPNRATTFTYKIVANEVEVGDIESTDFKPNIKLKRWGKECFIKVGFPTEKTIAPIVLENQKSQKIKWATSNKEINFYPTEKKEGFEFEIILKEKPSTNLINLDIEARNLAFYFQPPLNQEKQEQGLTCSETECKDKEGNVVIYRPENIVGSYAVYHKSKQGDFSKVGGKNYKAGKAFHIYRPKITDSVGKEVWGELNIDVENKILSIKIPQEFLDTAVYPVRIDPEFGYHTIGGSSLSAYNMMIGGNYAGSVGTVSMISFYGRRVFANSRSKAALYKKSDYSLQSPQSTHISVPVDNAWNDHTLTPSITAIDYIIAVWLGYWDSHIYYDTVSGWGKEYHKLYTAGDVSDPADWNAWPNPLANTGYGGDRKFSIYCTYSAVGGLSIPIAMRHYRNMREM